LGICILKKNTPEVWMITEIMEGSIEGIMSHLPIQEKYKLSVSIADAM
jgi:hypothetical protein